MTRTLSLGLVLLLTAASTTHADPAPPRVEFSTLAHMGIATPYGFAGLGAEVTYLQRVSLEAGVGRGATGTQYALLLSARYLDITAGIGASFGAYEWAELPALQCDDFCDSRAWDSAKWLNAEVGYRHRWASGFVLGGYLGRSFMLNADDVLPCTDPDGLCGQKGDGERLTFVGLRLGYTF